MNFYFSKYHLITVFLFPFIFLNACKKQEIPEYKPRQDIKTKTINMIFVDKADPTANIAIYINNILSANGTDGSFKGLQHLIIPDSLANRTLNIALAEYKSSSPSLKLMVNDLIYETFILPSEAKFVSTIAFSRDNPGSPIVLSKSGSSFSETPPETGYFKIRFYNISSNKIDVYRRNGNIFSDFANLNVVEERPYQQLPFGSYRFKIRRQSDGSTLESISPVFKGEAGKIYNILCTNDGQVITELSDFGSPNETYAYVGFANLLSNYPQVWAFPLKGSKRTEASSKLFARFDQAELVLSGPQTFTVDVGQEKLTASYNLKPYEYLMVYIVNNKGKPELQLIPTPIAEPAIDGINVSFLNFSADTGKVSFARIRTDLVLTGATESPSNVLKIAYASNLKFGEVRVTEYKETANSIYTSYLISRNTNDENGAPIIIQAYKATNDPFRLGEPIANSRADYPFLYSIPKIAVANYNGYGGDPGVYTVVLTGKSDETNPELRSKITVIRHSF